MFLADFMDSGKMFHRTRICFVLVGAFQLVVVPTRRAISRIGIPADFKLITSRTWHIANLSIGIQVSSRNGGRDHLGMAVTSNRPVGEIIPEWWGYWIRFELFAWLQQRKSAGHLNSLSRT